MHHRTLFIRVGQIRREFIRARDSGLEPAKNTRRLLEDWKAAVDALRVAEHYGREV